VAKLSKKVQAERLKEAAELKRKGLPIPKKLKKYSLSCRAYNRCAITGRVGGYYRKFGVCRHWFRKLASEGLIPGVKKASW